MQCTTHSVTELEACDSKAALKLAVRHLQFLDKNLIPYLITGSHAVKNVSLDTGVISMMYFNTQ